ncbi:FAD-binding domain-containing protein [Roridomyces roridus]|uniref:FAD-binding domain-containing protein n=1 Tax=Roridomyces roridus TaxID=1738132 RepID=A0AAD7B781_9AGAR|nr:FAD-binding domain-containing protein [Roridomyces roridus]
MFPPPWLLAALTASQAPLPVLAEQVPWASSVPWAKLNDSVDGRLVRGIPFARACFSGVGAGVEGSAGSELCAEVQRDYLNHVALQDSFGTYINTQWETCAATDEKCLLDFTDVTNPKAFEAPKICSQGSIPEYGVNVSSAQDVVEAFKFSKEHGVPLVVKNTGHDYNGRSGGPGTLAIWVHSLRGIVHDPEFRPTGCPATTATHNAVTIGAGITFEDLVNYGDENGLFFPVGGCISVGAAGGYPQGGGHGMLSNVYGLGADRMLEIEVVTPRGDHLIANECQNTDIFWAMRGGGGGTFGVALKITTKAYTTTVVNSVFATVDNKIPGNLYKFFKFFIDHALDYAKEGWGYYLYPSLPGVSLANTLLTPAEANASMTGLMNYLMNELEGSTWEMTVEPDYKTHYPKFVTRIPVPMGFAMTTTSRLIPVSSFEAEDKRVELAQAMTAIIEAAPVAIAFGVAPYMHGNKNETSVNPAWYDSLWHLAIANVWNYDADTAAVKKIYHDLSENMEPFRKLAPDSGAYMNEADVYEPNFEKSFWGDNYPRLLSIKEKYDPDHLLDCWQCVGWLGEKHSRYSCYIDIHEGEPKPAQWKRAWDEM